MVLKIEKVYNHQYLSDLRSPKKKSSTFKQFMKLRNVYLNQRVFAEGSYTIEQMLHIPLFACSSISKFVFFEEITINKSSVLNDEDK